MKHIFFMFTLTVFFFAGRGLDADEAGRRFALVIGNSEYRHVEKLIKPAGDAADIAGKLRLLGYQVELRLDADNAAMGRAVADYTRRLAADSNNEGFFWYAGHGVQLNGENYLLPVDIDARDDVALIYGSYPLNRLLLSLEQNARNKINVVVLDACRDNPFRNLAGGTRGLSRGLVTVEHPPQDLFIMFSTSPGTTAADGEPDRRNSPFAEAFLRYMEHAEILPVVASLITRETLRLTGGKQRPFQNGSIVSEVYYSLNPAARRSQDPANQENAGAVSDAGAARAGVDAAGSAAVTAAAKVPEAAALPAAGPATPPGFVRVAGGTFLMGSPGTEPGRDDDTELQHRVDVGALYIKAHEITVGEFREFAEAAGYVTTAEKSGSGYVYNPWRKTWEIEAGVNWKNPLIDQRDNHPVVMVSWFDALAYCNWLSRRDGLEPAYTINGEEVLWNRSAAGYRLPTEAEWEYACRAGAGTAYTTGTALTAVQANFNEQGGVNREKTTPVGSFAPNAWGLYDMHGNVWEWCWDWFGDYPAQGTLRNPSGPAQGRERINRGGGWSSSARTVRSAYRSYDTPETSGGNLGFRIVRPVQ